MRLFLTLWRSARPIATMFLCVLWTTGPAARQRPSTPAAPVDDRSLINLAGAVVVTPATSSPPERTAVRVLVEEIEKRTNVRLSAFSQWPADTVPAIAVGPLSTSSTWAGPGLRGAPAADGIPGREG